MNKNPGSKVYLLAAAICSVLFLGPAMTAAAEVEHSDSHNNLVKESSEAKASEQASTPKKMTSFVCGLVAGTPISIARQTYSQTRAGSRDLIGESSNPLLVFTTSAFSLPFALMGGPLEGMALSVRNSWTGSKREPFGKETFSLLSLESTESAPAH